MKRVLALSAILAVFSISSFAGIEDGQKLYLKACKACHGNGVKGAAMATQSEWDKWFADGGKAIVEKHKADPKANAYFGSPTFDAQKKDLHEFLKEYGSDSGNVPACG